jgi:hypothetical protein
LLGVLDALGYDIPLESEKFKSLSEILVPQARLRRYDAPLIDYLNSRIEAGTTHVDLVQAIEALNTSKWDIHVRGYFFSFQSKILWEDDRKPSLRAPTLPALSRDELVSFLAYWLTRDAVPIATLNLMLINNDAWHHQLIHGVDTSSKEIYLCNPCETMPMEIFRTLLCVDPFMRIPASHVRTRKDDSEERWNSLRNASHMNRFNVSDQINALDPNSLPNTEPSRITIEAASTAGDKELILPWGGLAGITLFFKIGSEGQNEIDQYSKKNSRSIPLPSYGIKSSVLFYDKDYFTKK